MVYCCVPMCKNKAGNSKFTFFHFPSDEKQRQLWTDRVRRINPDGSKWVPTPYSLICSYHFSKGRTQGAPDRFEWNENKQFIYSSPTKQNIRRRFDAAPSERAVPRDELQLSGNFPSVPVTTVSHDASNCIPQSCTDKSSNEGSSVANRESHDVKQFSRGKGTRCAVAACSNSLGRTKSQLETQDVRYHTFPKDPAIRQRWIESCRRTGEWKPASSHVCSEHFTPDDYERDLQAELMGTRAKKVLKKDAIPSRNLVWSTYVKVVIDPANKDKGPGNQEGANSSPSDKNVVLTPVDSQKDFQGEVLQQPPAKKLKPNAVPSIAQGTPVTEVDQPREQAAKEQNQSSRQVDELLSNPPESYVQLLEKSLKSVIVPALSPSNRPDVSGTRIGELESQVMELMESNSQLETMCKQLTLDNAVLQKKLATANGKVEKKGCRASALARELRGRTRQSRHLEKMEAAMDMLFTPSQKRLLLNRNKKVVWDRQTLAIAWTLRCISEQAYEYLRTNLKYPLPSHSTLKRTAASLKSGGLPGAWNGDSPDGHEELALDEPVEHPLDIKEENLSEEEQDGELSDARDEDLSDCQDSEIAPDIKEENLSDVSDAQDEDLSDTQEEIFSDVPGQSGAIQGLRSFCEQQMACFDMMECVLEEG